MLGFELGHLALSNDLANLHNPVKNNHNLYHLFKHIKIEYSIQISLIHLLHFKPKKMRVISLYRHLRFQDVSLNLPCEAVL